MRQYFKMKFLLILFMPRPINFFVLLLKYNSGIADLFNFFPFSSNFKVAKIKK